MIEDHQIGVRHLGRGSEFLQLAAPDQGCRIGAVAFLQRLSGNHRSGACRQLGKLFEGFFRSEWNQVLSSIVLRLERLPGLPRRRRNLSRGSGQMPLLRWLSWKLSGLVRALGGGIRGGLLPHSTSVVAARTVLDADQKGAFRPGTPP